jgi:hypothetical protein
LFSVFTAFSQQSAATKTQTKSSGPITSERGSVPPVAIEGKWTAKTPSGDEVVYAFKSSGTNFEGTITETSSGFVTHIKDGTVVGNRISFVEVVPMGGQDFTISYRGTVKGDVIVMTRDTHSDTVTVGANGKLTKSHDAPMKFVAKRSS